MELSELVKTNALVDDYNYELYEKETKIPEGKAKRIKESFAESFVESFVEGNTSGGGLTRSERLHDRVIQQLDNVISYNKLSGLILFDLKFKINDTKK